MWYNCYTDAISFRYAEKRALTSKPQKGIGFEEAQEIFLHPYYLDQRSDLPEQWAGDRLGG